MKQKSVYILLKIVKNKRPINALLREGMTFKEIGNLTEQAVRLKLIKQINNEIVLTEEGELTFQQLSNQFIKKNKEEWIQKEDDSQIEPLSKNSIYLPDPKELNFD